MTEEDWSDPPSGTDDARCRSCLQLPMNCQCPPDAGELSMYRCKHCRQPTFDCGCYPGTDAESAAAGARMADQVEARARAYIAPTWTDFDEGAQARSDAALREHDLEVEARIALKNNPRMGA